MTDSRTLLAEYARNGSEAAFRELVNRYVSLVYSTAFRLVDGDGHLAEDVAQTVFTNLAQKAGNLPAGVMLGGWLHQRTYNVAAPMMRAARRRQAREREAVLMSADPDHSSADFERITPILDEELTRLGADDRTAIILRFFERRDFRSIGAELGSNEDAARMRVNRALEKLHLLLKARGVALPAAALGAALSVEAAAAAPAELSLRLAGAALAGSSAGGTGAATLLKLGIMTKLKAGAIAAVVIAGVATSLILQRRAHANLAAQDQLLLQQSNQLARLTEDNQRLTKRLASGSGAKDQMAELLALRAEDESLRRQTSGLSSLREENRNLQIPREARPKTPLQIKEEQIAKMNFEKNWLLAILEFADKNRGRFPDSFEQVAASFPDDSKSEITVGTDQFEIIYHGPTASRNLSNIVAIREREPWTNNDGRLCKIYGLADGAVQVLSQPPHWIVGGKEKVYDTFEAFEKDVIAAQSDP